MDLIYGKGDGMMKRWITLLILVGCLLLASCNRASIGMIGGADGPTSVIVSQKNKDATKYFRKHYVDERKLPILDIYIENPFVSDDRTLLLQDSIENNLELMVYEYYRNLMAGAYQEAKDMILDESLLAATEASENNFKQGIYYSRLVLDEIDLLDQEDVMELVPQKKNEIIASLEALGMEEFAIVEVEKIITNNEKANSMGTRIENWRGTRYYLLGKKEDAYKIVDVYSEDFIND